MATPRQVSDAGAISRDGGNPSGDLTSPAADAGAAPRPIACPPAPTYYVTPPYVPAVEHQGLCTAGEISAFVSAAVSPGLSYPAWADANEAGFEEGGMGTPCGNCLFAPPKEDNGGVWVDPYGFFYPNYAGCVQILDPEHGPACAAANNVLTSCELVACDYCPGLGENDLTDCLDAADATSCASFLKTFNAACAADAELGGPIDTCTPDNGGPGDYVYVATLICGGAPSDGGPDGASDGAGD
jgi:hypothetical protein